MGCASSSDQRTGHAANPALAEHNLNTNPLTPASASCPQARESKPLVQLDAHPKSRRRQSSLDVVDDEPRSRPASPVGIGNVASTDVEPSGLRAFVPPAAPADDTPRSALTSDPHVFDATVSASVCDGDPVRERAHRIFGPVLPADDAALYRAGFAPTEVYELRRPSRRRPRAPPGWTHRFVTVGEHRSASMNLTYSHDESLSTDGSHTRRSDKKKKRKRFLLPRAAVSIERTESSSWEAVDVRNNSNSHDEIAGRELDASAQA